MKKDPLLTALHFEKRFKPLMKSVISGKQKPLGEVTDYFARVEFQNPHMHMLFWIEGIGQNTSREELIHYINSTICTSIPWREIDPEMNNHVQRLQSYSQTA